ncbi:MAG: putative metal-binding motif-containing protein [Myxococcales bacterium]|nr:putative metal-binding motif-containing protein [Myxococcales bacterium]
MQCRFSSCALAALALAVAACGGGKTPPEVPDSGTISPGPVCLDNDGDGVPGTGDCSGAHFLDCNDSNPSTRPGASEVCNGTDDDCDDLVDEELPIRTYYADGDGDGVGGPQKTGEGCAAPPAGSVTASGDCNDADPNVKPGAAEVCNGIDDDCSGSSDDGLTFKDYYPDADGDGFGDAAGTALRSCQASVLGKVPDNTDCNDQNATIKPTATEQCNKVDDNCDGQVDNGIVFNDYYPDADGDGFGAAGSAKESSCSAVPGKVQNDTDCNDLDSTVKPGAPEACNGRDDDCDSLVDDGLAFSNYYTDADGDGFGAASAQGVSSCQPIAGKVTNNGDCNDTNPAVKPSATESCNGVDDNCNGQADDGLTFASYYQDGDGDGFGAASGQPVSSCQAIAGRVTNNQDCDDANPSVKPTASEVCNFRDDNCNGQVDDGLAFASYYPDADGDGYGSSSAQAQSSCSPLSGKVTNNQDCDDALASVNPAGTEACNGRDDDCDSQTDEGLSFQSYWPDADGDGYGSSSAAAQSSCAPVAGKVTNNTDCNDSSNLVHPTAPETCNGVDDNCDGQIDNGTVTQSYYPDLDSDGYGAVGSTAQVSCSPVAGKVTNNTDCNDSNGSIHPGAAEACNGSDDDCDGQTDEGLTFLSYYPDLDSDGYGASGSTAQSSCAPVAGKVTNNTDCNDSNAGIKPGATEVCDGLDQDCDTQIDEGLPTQSYYTDADGDGYGATGATPQASCGPVSGKVTNNTDCNDANASVRPGAAESCNGTDDDCDTQVDEGNPGGGASCNTGQAGVCSAGTVTCQSGVLTCLRNQGPGTESCNGLDDDCDNSTDEDFPNKGQACTAGLGVCQRSGTYVCKADGTGTVCSATPGAPTAAACDGLDNDCDGVVDEPTISATADLSTVAYQDVELAPYYYSSASCAGGVNGSGTDALAGGALALGVGTSGLLFQRLDVNGAPAGTPVSATSLTYTDVALAQAGDGFLVAGLWKSGTIGIEVDLYYMDGATGAKRTYLWSLFNSGNALDSLRVVRGNGKRVTVLWRDSGVGIKLARVEPIWNATTSAWEIKGPGGAAVTSSTLVAGAGVQAGVGADSTHADWGSSQSCVSAASLRKISVAYRPSAANVSTFTANEDGSAKSADTVVRTETSRTLDEPEVAYFQSSGDQWFVAYITRETGTTPQADLNFWLTNDQVWHYAYLAYGTENGANSIFRPRATVSSTRIWLSAIRYVADTSTFKRQIMTRKIDFAGSKDPTSSSVELSATSGSCTSNPPCRPGDKDGLSSWAAKSRVFYGGSGSIPAGTFDSTLSCQ